MRLGFSTVMFEQTGLSYPKIIRRAAALCYEGIELNFREWPTTLNKEVIRAEKDSSHVEIAAIGTRHFHITHGLYLSSPYKDVREKALVYVTECMKIARVLDCSIIQAGWAFQGSKQEAGIDILWKHAVESLERVGKQAVEYGVQFVIEFAEDAQFVKKMDDALHILEEVKCENVLVMADIFAIYMVKDNLGETIRKGGKKLGYVHLADSERLPPGRGLINFKEVFSALKDIDYNGYMVMELEPKPNPDEALRQALDYVKKLL